jgi:hypothetical protein
MRIIKDDNLERNVNKVIGNIMEEYFKNTNILKSDFNPMAEEPAKFKILIGKKEFFKNLEADLKKAIIEEVENNKVYVNNRIVNLKTDEALTKIEKISSEKSRYSSYETIEELSFEFLIKHYNENRIEDKITEEQLNLYSNLKEEVFKESINELLDKKEYIKNDKKIYLDDIKEIINSSHIFEEKLSLYKYYEKEQTTLDKEEVGMVVDLKTFQRIKEHDWFQMENRIIKEILVPNYEKNIYDFIEKVKEHSEYESQFGNNSESEVISLKKLTELVDNFDFTNEKTDIVKLLGKKIENYLDKEKKETWEEIKNSLVTFSLEKNYDAFEYQSNEKGLTEIFKTIELETKNKFLTEKTGKLLDYFYRENMIELGLTEKELMKIEPVEYLEKNLLKELKSELETELKNNDYDIKLTYHNYNNEKNNHIINEYNDILDFVCENINNTFPNVHPLQYFNGLGIGKLCEEKYEEKEEYYFINNFYKVNNSEDKDNKIREDVYKMIENKGDMSLLEANEILRDFKTFDNEKVIEEMLKVLPNVVERNAEDMKMIFVDSFKEKMKEQLKELKEREVKEDKNYKRIKEYEKEL